MRLIGAGESLQSKANDSVDAASLPEPEVLAAEALSELREALRELEGLMTALEAQ